jgi:hypothetical protein
MMAMTLVLSEHGVVRGRSGECVLTVGLYEGEIYSKCALS